MGQYADLFEDDSKKQAGLNLRFGVEASPDEAARNAQLAKRYGLPEGVISEFKPDYEARAKTEDAMATVDQSPKLRGWLAAEPTRAKVVHDDLQNMGMLESGLKYLVSAPNAPRGGALTDVAKAIRGVASGAPMASSGLYGAAAAPFELLGMDTIGGFLRDQSKSAKGVAGAVSGLDPQAGLVERGVMSGFQSAGQNLIMLPFGLANGAKMTGEQAMLGLMGVITGGQSYVKGREAGLNPGQAINYGAQDAVAEVVTEKYLGMAGFLKNVKAGASAGKLFMFEVTKEVPGEMAATLWQNFNEWTNLNPNKSIGEFLAEQPAALAETAIATLVGGGTQIGAIKGAQRLMGGEQKGDQLAAKAEEHAAVLEGLQKTAEASKLLERSPETLTAYMQELADEGAPNVYIDSAKLVESGVDLQALAQVVPSIATQLEQVESGGDLVIPTSELLVNTIGTEFAQSLIDHARTDVNGMSREEAKVYMQEKGNDIQAEVERVMTEKANDAEFKAGRDEVQQQILKQLNEVQRFTGKVNEQYASLAANFYSVMAARTGMTPQAFAQRYQLGFSGTAEAGGSVLDQESQAFKEWFGDSKAVGADGRPLVAYHGTTRDFAVFKTGDVNSQDTVSADLGAWFAAPAREHFDTKIAAREARNTADSFAEMQANIDGGSDTVYPVYLAVKNPLEFQGYADLQEALNEAGSAQSLRASAVAAGHDGLVVRDSRSDNGHWRDDWVVFDPTQIKSATGNKGTYDKNDPNILNQSLSSRLPTAVKATEDPLDSLLNISFDVVLSDEKTLAKNVAALQDTPNMRKLKGKGAKDPVRNVEAFIDHVVKNLLWLHDRMPQEMRDRAHLWYDGGRKTIEAWAKRYGISEMQGAAAIAVLSPQNGWFANVSQAERIADMVFGLRDKVWDDKMTAEGERISKEDGLDDKMKAAQGKTLGELLATPDIAARWVRVYDQAYNNRAYRVLTPEGGAADYVKTNKGADATMMWKSYVTISKAISVLTDGRAENVHYQIGQEHKVRNFYNNLFAPNSELGFATIDTHAVAAALLRPLSSADIEVAQAFGGGGSASSAVTGLRGTYPIYLEAYRLAAKERGILPREMQSITWEAVRGLFEAAKKSGLKKGADAIWGRYKAGEIEQEQAQKEILELAGDITPPSWTDVPFNDTPSRTYEGDAQKAIDARGDVGAAANPTAKVMFEVAPDPNDEALTAEWNALPGAERLRISQEVAAKIVPKVLKELGTDGDFVMQMGGYEGATNPSMTLRLARPELTITAAKLLGHALAQDSMMVVTESQIVGTDAVGAVTIALPEGYGEAQITALYDKLWELEHEGQKLVGGHTTSDGRMVVLNYSALTREELADAIDKHLGGEFAISSNEVYSAWPAKEEYGYGSDQSSSGDTTSRQSPAQRRPDSLRAEATGLLRDALDGRDKSERGSSIYKQSGAGPDGRPGNGSPEQTDGAGGRGARAHAVSLTGVHFSTGIRTFLDGRYNGRGLKGAERARLALATDPRIKQRVYVYVDEGQGIRPEAGVGAYAHEVPLNNLYNVKGDPLGLFKSRDDNANESAVLDAGFDGYYVPAVFNHQGVAVVLGDASHNVAAKAIPRPDSALPPDTTPVVYKRGLMSKEVNALDIAAIQAVAPSAKVRSGTFMVDASEFEAAQAEAVKQGVNLPNTLDQQARGQIAFGNDITQQASIISLFKNADLSTFIHESGHFFLEVQADLASRITTRIAGGQEVTEGERGIVADFNTTLAWMGVNASPEMSAIDHWYSLTAEEKRPYHEQWARGFEAYAFEGKAPSLDLQHMFQTFRAWLVNVYRTIKDSLIGDTLNVQLNDEVRAVMDRMLATSDQIAEAEAARQMGPLFKTAEEAGMTLEEFKAYHDQGIQATMDAVDELQAKGLRDMQWLQNARSRKLKELQKQHDALRAEITAQVRTEVMAQPIYRVWAFLTSKSESRAIPGVTDLETADLTMSSGKLRTQVLRDMYGIEDGAVWRKLSNLHMTSDEIGLHPDHVAELFEFSSGDELVQKLADAEDPKSVIEGMTDTRMLQEHGDLASPAGLERAADAAIHNDARARFVATELKALQKAMSVREKVPGQKNTVDVLARAAKDYASAIIAKLKVRDIRPAQYAAAEVRSAKAAQKAAGDLAKATMHKRNQLINMYAAKEAYAAQDEVKKAIEYFRKFDKPSKTIDPEYTAQIEVLLERFDLRASTSLAAIDKRASLVEWVQSQVEQGLEPAIPPELLQEANRKSFKEMTLEEVRGLRDTIKQIEHIGRLKNRLLTSQANKEFQAVVEEMATSINLYAGDRQADTRTPNTVLGEKLVSLKNFWASHIKAATWARVMDGGKDGGPVWEYLIRTANHAGDTEVAMREKATKELHKLVEPIRKEGKLGGKGTYFKEIDRSLNKEARLAIALNVGNASNLQRLLGGEGWTLEQIQPVLNSLSAADWQFVQAVWDHFESYRPMIAAKETRVYGKEPEWVEPTPVNTQHGTLRGGYYPVKYDPRASERAESHADAEDAKRQLAGAYTSATTRRSFTKARVEEVKGRPLLYSLDGIYNGVQEVIHDLTWHEWLIDANKLVRNKRIAEAIRSKYGPDAHRQFKTWLEDNAAGDRGAQNAGEKALAWARQGVSISGLGWNLMSAAIQPLGLTQSIVRIGPKWVGKGISKALGSPLDTVDEINEKSEFMRTRALTRLREIAEVRSQVKGRTKAREMIDTSAYFFMMRAQQLVDVPTWWGAYEKAINEGNDESRAVALSDQAVIDAQGSGAVKDQSAIERGGPVLKLFTTFYSFFNVALNLGVQKTMTSESKAKLAADYMLLYSAPVILAAALKDALVPGDSGDWDDEKILKRLIGEHISFLMGLMFGVREASSAVQAATGTNQFPASYSGPAGLRLADSVTRLGKEMQQGEMDDGLRKAVINTAGMLLRLPSAQINRTVTGAQALRDGKTENLGALLTGYQEPH